MFIWYHQQTKWYDFFCRVDIFFIVFLPWIVACKAIQSSEVTANKSSKPVTTLKKTKHLLQSDRGNTMAWSNAFNFTRQWNTRVDPRTGTLNAHIKAGSLLSNSGHGPDIDLEVNYNSNAIVNLDGLGYGWSWNLTHFNPVTNQLITSTGQSFYLQKKSSGQWVPLYHKLQDICITGNKKTHFVITYANGLRETLNHAGYEVILEQQNGWCVRFVYVPGTHLLHYVVDDEGHSILLHYHINDIIVTSKASEGQPVSISLSKQHGELYHVILPLQQTHPSIDLHYAGHLITGLYYPTGLKKTFTYNCKDEMKIPVLSASQWHSLCVISRISVFPGAGQPTMTVSYHYSQANKDEHNYLGFNANLSAIRRVFRDILFEAPANYTYQTEEDNGIVREIRTYNKYHLLINDEKISDHNGQKISAVHTFFCRPDRQDGCANLTFADLPAAYSKPLKIIYSLWSSSSVHPAVSTETMAYDRQGRIIWQKDTFGRLKKIGYCPVIGSVACPVSPAGWPVNTLKQWLTIYPAKIAGQQTPPAVMVHNYYRKMFNHTKHGYTAVLDHQRQQSQQQYTNTQYYYYQNTNDTFTYGLLRKIRMTGSVSKPSVLNSIIKDYYYFRNADNKTKTVYSAVELKSGKQRLSSLVTTSLLTNQLLQDANPLEKNITRYHYDLLGRIVQQDIAKGTRFATKRYYHYTVSPALNQLLIIMTNGLQKKVIFDRAGRPLMQFREALSDKGKPEPGHWFPVQKNSYDNHGRIAAQYHYTVERTESIQVQTITQDYDDSGRITQVHLPDGETKVMIYDDADRCTISYRQSNQRKRSPVAVIRANVLYKPVMQLLLPASNGILPAAAVLCHTPIPNAKITTTVYDGFGRTIMTTDPMGHIIKKYYNAQGQVTDVTDPSGNVMHRVYDLTGHVIQSWALPASGGHYLLASAQYNAAGDCLWSAGEDGRRTFFTYTKNGRLSSTITPSGHTFTLHYNDAGLPVKKWVDGKLILHIYYDTATATIAKKTDDNGTTLFIYDADGLIRQLIYSGKSDYPDYQLQWQYDKNRRITGITDTRGNTVVATYDALGRVIQTSYHAYDGKTETLVKSTYGDFSQIQQLYYGSGMKRSLYYDTFGHQLKIIDTLSNKVLSGFVFQYDATDNITTLIEYNAQQQFAHLHYQYDALNNLVSMTCNGSSGLPLCPRDTTFTTNHQNTPVITRQKYTFTPLNRLGSIQETLQNPTKYLTLNKRMDYEYTEASAPLRLQQIKTILNLKQLQIQHFSYDITGNMIRDGENNHIIYNAFNQIIRVINPRGAQSDYTYDGSSREVKEKNITGIHYLLYFGNKLLNEQINTPEETIHRIGYLGVAKTIDDHIAEYEESNYKGDIIGVLTKKQNSDRACKLWQRNLYSPYGMVFHSNTASLPEYKKTLAGFNGERTDPATGWQFLGAGHRTYNPGQRYFFSEDPAGGGYGFGSNNPIMNTDPSGNIPQWMGGMLKWFGYISSFGLNALHAKWANIAGAVMMGGLTVVALGTTAVTYGGTALASVVTGGSAICGVIPVIAAAIPANKGLNIAASVIGLTATTATIATMAFGVGMFLFSLTETVAKEAGCIPMFTYNMLGEGAHLSTKMFDTALPIIEGLLYKLLASAEEESDVLLMDNECYLGLNHLHQVNIAWNVISRAPFYAKCDAATILLVAKHNNMLLPVRFLEVFIIERQNAIKTNNAGAYIRLLGRTLNSLASTQTRTKMWGGLFFAGVFNDFAELVNRAIPENADTAAVAFGDHMTVLQKHPDGIQVYAINKGFITREKYPLNEIEEKFFGGAVFGNLKLHGYMALINPLQDS